MVNSDNHSSDVKTVESTESTSSIQSISSPEDASNDVKVEQSDPKNKIPVIDEPSKSSSSDSDDNLIEVEDGDDYLLHLETILRTIHRRFYAYYKEHDKVMKIVEMMNASKIILSLEQIPDLKILIPKIRSEVLVGKTLVFSGLVPNHLKLEQSRAYLIAKGLGATVRQQLTSDTTHLVAATAGISEQQFVVDCSLIPIGFFFGKELSKPMLPENVQT